MNSVFKVFREHEWKSFQEEKSFQGSAHDLKDGFIHLSNESQIEKVIQKYFSEISPIYVAKFSKPEFLQQLKWEASSTGEIYPHLYSAPLLVSDLDSFQLVE